MRGALAFLLAAAACGEPDRDNPLDPANQPDPGIELIAALPADAGAGSTTNKRLAAIQFTVNAADMSAPITGPMNLVGDRATAQVLNVPVGPARVFRVDAFDVNQIRTFSVSDTVEIGVGFPQVILMSLERLTGTLELISDLPPEVVALDVTIAAAATSIVRTIDVESVLNERISGIPTGTGIRGALSGRDVDDQVVVERVLAADIRVDLIAHIRLPAEIGALHVVANFPGYIPIAEVDRYSDGAGTFFRRSENPSLPAANEAIDFDEDFLLRGIGPNGEIIEFYHLDVRLKTPAPLYLPFDARGDAIEGQLPIFGELPGDPGYNDLRLVQEVTVTDRDYRPNSATSLEDLLDAGYDVMSTELIMNCVVVPDGSVAAKRFDSEQPLGLQNGWYSDQIVRFLLFENPDSATPAEFSGGEVSTPIMYAFFDNDADPSGGFAVEDGSTHNVAVRLPGQEGYSPLWALQLFRLAAFDRVFSVASALDQARNEENKLALPGNEILHVNAPIVAVIPGG